MASSNDSVAARVHAFTSQQANCPGPLADNVPSPIGAEVEVEVGSGTRISPPLGTSGDLASLHDARSKDERQWNILCIHPH